MSAKQRNKAARLLIGQAQIQFTNIASSQLATSSNPFPITNVDSSAKYGPHVEIRPLSTETSVISGVESDTTDSDGEEPNDEFFEGESQQDYSTYDDADNIIRSRNQTPEISAAANISEGNFRK